MIALPVISLKDDWSPLVFRGDDLFASFCGRCRYKLLGVFGLSDGFEINDFALFA